jgi:hypothetical protein
VEQYPIIGETKAKLVLFGLYVLLFQTNSETLLNPLWALFMPKETWAQDVSVVIRLLVE